VTCAAENTLAERERLMQKHQIRRLPVVNKEGRCMGMIAQADIALRAPAAELAKTLAEISRAVRAGREMRAASA